METEEYESLSIHADVSSIRDKIKVTHNPEHLDMTQTFRTNETGFSYKATSHIISTNKF